MTKDYSAKRFNDLVYALLNQPLGRELVDILKHRMLRSENVFSADTPAAHDKFYLGRHSVYKDLIKIAETPPKKQEKENE